MSKIQDDPRFFVFDFDAVFDVDDYLYFYEDTLIAERTEHQIAFLEQHLEMAPPMRVLDLGCGHGRHANLLAERGYVVFGIDRTAGFLDLARNEAAARGLDAVFVHADLRELDSNGEFDRVLCLFDVFGLHRDDENLDILRRVHRALRPGGRLCLDVRNRDWMIRAIPPVTVMQKGADFMIDRHTFDPISGRLVDFRVILRDGRTKEAPFSVRLYSFSELRALLESVGFEVTAAFGAWDGSPIALHQNRMVVMAEKPAG